MNIKTVATECEESYSDTNRKTTFNVVQYLFNYQSSAEDKAIIDLLIKKGLELAAKVNPGAANDGMKKRKFERIQSNCVAGLLAEFCWLHYLNDGGKTNRVAETAFENASNQIDLRVIKNDNTIEVRSSFPRANIPFVLCHPKYEFDVIGPYKNDYKPSEIQKDFYVRTLYRMESPLMLLDLIQKDGFVANLTGGATWAMVADNSIAKEKNFVPDDELSMDTVEAKSTYRVVPFSKALDTLEIYKLIAAI
jgi:hypothetical protein